MVVYQSSVGNNYYGNQTLIEEVPRSAKNQVLIQLPDTSKMLVEVRVANP